MQDVKHLLNRIAFGARPGDVERVQKMGVDAYLDEQLHPDRIDDSSTEERLSAFVTIRMSTSELMATYRQRPQTTTLQMRPILLNVPPQILLDLQSQKLVRAVHSRRQLQEVLTDFWFNHFNIFWGKNA